MSDIIEISEIDINSRPHLKSSNFGDGIELLMNDKIKESSKNKFSDEIDLSDLDKLENELNMLSDNDISKDQPKSDLFSVDHSTSNNFEDTSQTDRTNSVTFQDTPSISLGKSTLDNHQNENNNKTWDGYSKFNNIPINPEIKQPEPKLTAEELLREKFKYLRKLEGLERKGVELSKKYNMESSLQEMQGEYETIIDEKSKQNSVKFQGNMLMACINGIEFLNGKFDPFDIKIDGWSEQINENITDYDDIFGELYEKYNTKAKMAPELKLLFQLGGSAMMVHMTNTMFKSAMPGMDDILRQNPDLMKSFQSAAVNSMSGSNPGLSGFMNNVMGSDMQGPPPPRSTQGENSAAPPYNRPGNNDNIYMNHMNTTNDRISVNETNYNEHNKNTTDGRSGERPEMKGPSDISDILSGLKTKSINIQRQQSSETNDKQYISSNQNIHSNTDSSTISISDLKELQSDVNMPKKSKRRQKSASNTISLDI